MSFLKDDEETPDEQTKRVPHVAPQALLGIPSTALQLAQDSSWDTPRDRTCSRAPLFGVDGLRGG